MSSANAVQAPPDNANEQPRRPLKKAFISYASRDRRFARRIARDLRARDVIVWMDETGIHEGAEWREAIVKAVAASEDVLLVVSPASRESKYVAQELAIADELNKPLTPLRRKKCRPWLGVTHLQHIDFTEWYAEGLAKLLQRPVPPRTIWRRTLIFLYRLRTIVPVLALLIGIAAYSYYFSPSETYFEVAQGDANGIIELHAHNRGGQPSMLLGSSFILEFGGLPIQPRKLEMLEPAKVSRIPGHTEVIVQLTTFKPLTPKERNDGSYYTVEQLPPLVPGKIVRLWGLVDESGNRLRRRHTDSYASRIQPFIERTYPKNVRETGN